MKDLRHDGRVALITGVSTEGLGLAYARVLAAGGCRLVVNDLGVDWKGNRTDAETDVVVELLRAEGATVHGVTGNVVTDAESIVTRALDAFGGLDIVINNAGSGGDFDTLIDVHLRGAHRMTQAAWPSLVASDRGRIVNVSSSGSFGAPSMPGYAAAKAGIQALTRTQAIIGAPDGICSNAILPSAWTRATAGIDSPGFAEFMADHFPTDAVAAFVSYLSHTEASVSGEAFAVGGGLVTRIAQAETRGVVADANNPAAWAALIDQVLDPAQMTIPSSMWDHLGGFTRKLSPEAHSAWNALGIK